MRSTRLTAVAEDLPGETDETALPASAPPKAFVDAANRAATHALIVALKALSQRAIVGLANLYALALAASAFFLWYRVLPTPSILQLVGLGMYGVFVLAMLALRRRA